MLRLRLSIAALLLVGVGIAACSSSKKEEPKKEAAEPAAVPAAATAPAATPEAPPAIAPAPAPRPAKARPARTVRPARSEPRVYQAEHTIPAPPRTPVPPPAPPIEGPVGERNVAPPAPQPPPPPATAVLRSGARVAVRLAEPLSSARNQAGETFRAVLERSLEVDGQVLAPAGSTVVGKIVSAEQSGRVEGRARMAIALTGIEVDKQEYAIESNSVSFEAQKSTKQDAMKVGGGAALGAIIGAIAGGGKGAAIGAAVGGAAGTGTVLATRGKDVEIKAEDVITFRLESDVTMRVVQ